MLAQGGKEFGLLHGVHTQVGLEVQFQVQHFGRVAGFFSHHGQDEIPHGGLVLRDGRLGQSHGNKRGGGCFTDARRGSLGQRRYGNLNLFAAGYPGGVLLQDDVEVGSAKTE